jgi:hypothetical protein
MVFRGFHWVRPPVGRPRGQRRTVLTVFLGVSAMVGAGIVAAATVSLAGDDDVTVKPVPFTEEQELEALSYLPGPKHVALVQPTPDPNLTADKLQRYGPYRIVPAEFAGDLPYTSLNPGFDPGEASYDPAVVRESPLYLDLTKAVPDGFAPTSVDTNGDAGVNLIVRQVFEDEKGRRIEVLRSVVLVDPVDTYVALHAPGASYDAGRMYQTELGYIREYEALLTGPTDHADDTYNFSSIEFIQSGIKVAVLGHGLSLETLTSTADVVAALGGP